MARSLGKITFLLAVEDEPPSSEGAHEPLPCAQLTLGIDPRRTDSGVGGWLSKARPTLGGHGRVGERQQENHRVSDVAFA